MISSSRFFVFFFALRTVQQPGKRRGSRSVNRTPGKVAAALCPGQGNIQKPKILSEFFFFGACLMGLKLR